MVAWCFQNSANEDVEQEKFQSAGSGPSKILVQVAYIKIAGDGPAGAGPSQLWTTPPARAALNGRVGSCESRVNGWAMKKAGCGERPPTVNLGNHGLCSTQRFAGGQVRCRQNSAINADRPEIIGIQTSVWTRLV